jgi:hypothetical protein
MIRKEITANIRFSLRNDTCSCQLLKHVGVSVGVAARRAVCTMSAHQIRVVRFNDVHLTENQLFELSGFQQHCSCAGFACDTVCDAEHPVFPAEWKERR